MIDHSLGLDVSKHTLELRIRALEETKNRLRGECLDLQIKLKERAELVDRTRVASSEGLAIEQHLLDSFLTTLVGNDQVLLNARALLMGNSGLESFQKLLALWNSLRPSTQKVMALATHVKSLETDKEHLRTNLTKVEEEVNLLYKENKILDKENKRLLRQQRVKCYSDSNEKSATSASAKGSKRKFSPVEGRIDFNESDSPRKPLSSLQQNSPEARTNKK